MKATIQKETMQFLRDLTKNNNRDWFEKNKNRYLEAHQNWLDFAGALIKEISKFDKAVAKLEPKDCVFRIYRDTRFSKDKSPYKNNFGAHFAIHGKASSAAAYYVHLSPGEIFLAGGCHMLEPKQQKALRDELSENPNPFLKMVNDKTFKNTFELWGEKLANVPKGFDKEDPMAEFLKYKQLTIMNYPPEKDIYSEKFIAYCGKIFKQMVPFNNYVNRPVLSV